MRAIAPLRLFMRLRHGGGGILAHFLRIGLAISLFVSLCGVHSALAHASSVSASAVTISAPGLDHSADSMALEQAAHLAGHLTGVVDPALEVGSTQDGVAAPRSVSTGPFPVSATASGPSEPPRA